MIDPDNPVVKRCAEGMAAEAAGRPAEAAALFLEAWELATDDYEACVAAHYLARHQSEPADLLHWNQLALDRAELVADDRVAGFFPSLHLNLGYALEQSGDRDGAGREYRKAAAMVERLPSGPYGDLVRDGVRRGLERVAEPGPPDT